MFSKFKMKTVIQLGLFTSGVALLNGCSTTHSSIGENVRTALAGDEDNYRKSESSLKPSLEVPPDLISPVQKPQEVAQLLRPMTKNGEARDIPIRKFNDIQVKTNLSERWLEIPISANASEKAKAQQLAQVWQDVQSFLISLGFEVDEIDQTLGVMRTKYKARTEIAPMYEMGLLTRLFNSWRPEKAEGVYDRLTARVESDLQKGIVRLYFYDHVLYRQNDGDIDRWYVRPYSPELEALTLYQGLIFLGVSSNQAFKQIEVTQHIVTPEIQDKDEKIMKGVQIKAPYSVAWTYTKALLYRAGWQITKVDEARHQLWVKPPKSLTQAKGGVLDRIFSKQETPVLPEQLVFTLKTAEQGLKDVQILEVHQPKDEAQGITAQQQAYIFKVLGFLAQ
ncbi:hypothetical protein [Galenea microaerophila]